jgi:hypothetical protein
VEVERLADGLWRWTTTDVVAEGCPPGRAAASVYLETPDGVLLFDPAVPADGSADGTRFWRALDADVARLDRPVVVLLTRPRHARATAAILGRYAERGATAVGALLVERPAAPDPSRAIRRRGGAAGRRSPPASCPRSAARRRTSSPAVDGWSWATSSRRRRRRASSCPPTSRAVARPEGPA